MNLIDKIFKIGILIVAIAFVYVYFLSVQNNRYHFFADDLTVFDTRTGIFYTADYAPSIRGDEYTVEHYDLKNNKITYEKPEKH